jgi:hypothetical protein
MTEDKKHHGWSKSVEKAGLMDDVGDSWTLTDDDDTKVVVEAAKPKKSPPDGERTNTEPPPLIIEESGARRSRDDSTQKIAIAQTNEPMSAQSETSIRILMKERFAVGDYSGAMELAEQCLEEDPDDHEASLCRLKCKKTLMQMYESRIGAFDRAPERAISHEEIIWRNLDPVAGFIVATVDGYMTFEDLIDISTVSRFETCKILSQLLQDEIIK